MTAILRMVPGRRRVCLAGRGVVTAPRSAEKRQAA